jgi:hypothetical protein
MMFIPDATLGPGWQSSSSPSDISKGMLYLDGLLFDLSGPGVQRQFVITNNRSTGQWDVQTSTVQTVGPPIP